MSRPKIIVTIGDPAGIGPETVVKALLHKEIYDVCAPVIIGDLEVLKNICDVCDIELDFNVIKDVEEAQGIFGKVDLIDLKNVDMSKFAFGEESGMCGIAAYQYIEKSIELALKGKANAVATGTINKKSLQKGNINYIGHTEIFGDLTGTHDPLTMFEVRDMRVFFLSRHVSLREACDLVTKERVLDYIIRCNEALNRLGINDGVMAIAGLNPHSGEEGLFGTEEMDAVVPAIEEAKKRGYKVEGPIGADSVFHQALHGKYNSVLSLYHDQGHIATKTLDFERTIAITNSMPFLRTSVDHGSAFDIAGQNKASEVSMVEAIILAAKYSPYFTT